jgi:putative ABC transport system substrate-binding protein
MRRREFIALLGGAATAPLTWPRVTRAQQRGKKIPRIGIIDDAPIWNHFREALRQGGFIDGQTIAYEYRAAGGRPEQLAAAAAELAGLPVDLIATFGTPASRAAKAATSTIPIVAISVGDPIRAGLIESFARPGGNVTGNTILGPDLSPKRLQLIKEVVPTVARVGFLWNPDNVSNAAMLDELRPAARALGMVLIDVTARSADDFDPALAAILKERIDAILMTNDPFQQQHVRKVIDFAIAHRLPSIFQTRENVVAGGLMSYGASFSELFRNGGAYALKILQGTRPEDLPVLQPERFELVINLKTAKAIGLKITEAFLLRCDEVIE